MRRGAAVWGVMAAAAVLAGCGSQGGGSARRDLPKGVAWAYEAGGSITSAPVVAGDRLVVASTGGTIQSLARKDGSLQWKYDATKDTPEATFHHESLITGGLILNATKGKGGGHVYAFDLATGQPRWKHPLGADPNNTAEGGSITEVIQRGEHVFAIGLDRMLVCLDLQTGNKVWTTGPVEPGITPAAGPSHVYVAVDGTRVQGLDPATGQAVWDADLEAVVTTSLVASGAEVFAGTSPFRMFRLDGATGAILSKIALQGKPVHNPVMSAQAVSVFLRDAMGGSENAQTIISLDPALGRILWGRKATAEWTSLHPLLYHDLILAGDSNGELFAYGQVDGARKWSVKLDQGLGAIGMGDDMLYVGTLRGAVYAVPPPASPS
jgi:outer membrane protein assembly factor BamB